MSAARAVRELVTGWQASVPGRTVLLTTHYMAEADEMCERIAIVDRGRVLAIGTPAELKQRVQRESIFRIELDRLTGGPGRAGPLARAWSARPRPRPATGSRPGHARARPSRSTSSSSTTRRSAGSSARSGGLGSRILALRKSEPTLEEVFVELVGRGFDDDDESARRNGTGRRSEGPDRPATAHEPGEPEPEEVG